MKRRRSSIIKRITAVPFNDALELLAEIIAEKHVTKHAGSSSHAKHANYVDRHKRNKETDDE